MLTKDVRISRMWTYECVLYLHARKFPTNSSIVYNVATLNIFFLFPLRPNFRRFHFCINIPKRLDDIFKVHVLSFFPISLTKKCYRYNQ